MVSIEHWWVNAFLICFSCISTIFISKIQRAMMMKKYKVLKAEKDKEFIALDADLTYICDIAIRSVVRFAIQAVILTLALSIPIILYIIFFYEDGYDWKPIILYLLGWFTQFYTMFFTLYTAHEFQIPTAYFSKQNVGYGLSYILVNGQTIGQIVGAGSVLVYWLIRLSWNFGVIDWDASDELLVLYIKDANDDFLCYAIGTLFFYVFFRLFAQLFRRSGFLAVESLSRTDDEISIEEDHPKNPATFIMNLGDGYIKAVQESLEYVALITFAFTAINMRYINLNMKYHFYSIDAPLTLFALAVFIKSILSYISDKMIEKTVGTPTNVDFKKLEGNTIVALIVDNILIIVLFVFGAWLLIPNIGTYHGDTIGLGGEVGVFTGSLIFVLIISLIQTFFVFGHHSPGEHIKKSAKTSLSVVLLDAQNISQLETLISMTLYAVLILVVHHFLHVLGLCYFLLALVTTYITAKGNQFALSIANDSEILIQSSTLNPEILRGLQFRKISYACKCLTGLSSGISLYILFTAIIIVVKLTDKVLDGVEITGSKIIYCVMHAALVLAFGRYLICSFQLINHDRLTNKIRESIVSDDFLNKKLKDPNIPEFSKLLANSAFIHTIIIYVVLVLWAIVWWAISFASADVGGILIGTLISLAFLCYLCVIADHRLGLCLERLKDYLTIEDEKAENGPEPIYVGLISKFMGKTHIEEISNAAMIILLGVTIIWLITHDAYNVWNEKSFDYDYYQTLITTVEVVTVTIEQQQQFVQIYY